MRVVLNKELQLQPRGKCPNTLAITPDYRQTVDITLDGRSVLQQHTRILCGNDNFTIGIPAKLGPNLRLQLLQLVCVLSIHFAHIIHTQDVDFQADLDCLIARRSPGLASSLGLYL